MRGGEGRGEGRNDRGKGMKGGQEGEIGRGGMREHSH